ncbi:hypothetical protein AMAG_18010 [Allomyces macrogynus ATCC 38327]|uniref:Uncharacterized protein n=1 Tax=Allomyces macrogynus (strain ATCC 38327) TaxID=578462 RepID=A0A0L0S449_ALLM3|nr:hypothetical protein AMAG_18010 [Allomyces macrogynus ATCC 38327]|eukprot:KNE57171.1 hypothetical protein AMAG_18010 [Allomyces macrogynus ATCC 38327]
MPLAFVQRRRTMGGGGPSVAPVAGSISSSDLPTALHDPPTPTVAPTADPHARAPGSRLGSAGANLRQFFAHRAHGGGNGTGPGGAHAAAHHANTDDSDAGELLDFLDDGGDEAGEFFLLGGDLSTDDNDDAPDPAVEEHDDGGGARMPGPASHSSSSDALAGHPAPYGDPVGGTAAAGSAAHALAASSAGGRDSNGAATGGPAGLALASLWGYLDLPSLVSGDAARLGADGGASDGTGADGNTKNDANLNWLSPVTYIGLLTYPPGGLALVQAMNGAGGGAAGKPVTKATFSTLRETALVRNRRRLLTMFTSYSLVIRYCSFDAFLLILLLSNCLILYYLKNARKINVQMAKRNIKQRVGWAKQWAGGLFRRGNPNGGGGRNDGPDGAAHDDGIVPGGVGPVSEHSGDSNDMPLVSAPNSTEKKKRRGIPFRRPTISGTTTPGGGVGTTATATNSTLPAAAPALGALATTTTGAAPTTSSGPASPAPVPSNKQGTARRINLFRRAASVEAGPDKSNPFAATADAPGGGGKDDPAPLMGSGSLGSVAIGAALPSGSTLLDTAPPAGGTAHSASSSTSSSTGSGSTSRLAKKTTGFLFSRRRANSGNPRDLLGAIATVAAGAGTAPPSASSGVDDGGPETTSDESWVSYSPDSSPTHAVAPPLIPPHPLTPVRVLPPAQFPPPLALEHGARGDESTATFAAPPRSPTAVNVTHLATTVPAVVTTESRPPARAGSGDALPELVAGLDAVLATLPSPNTPPSEPVTALPPPQDSHARATTAPAGTRSGSEATMLATSDAVPPPLPHAQALHPPDLPPHPASAPMVPMTRRGSAPRTTPTHSRQPSDGTGAGAAGTGASAAALRSLASGPRMSAVVGKAKDLWGHVKEKTAAPLPPVPPPVPPPSGYHDHLSQHRARGLPESPAAAVAAVAERAGAGTEGQGAGPVGPAGNGAGMAGSGAVMPGEGLEVNGAVSTAADSAGAGAVASS